MLFYIFLSFIVIFIIARMFFVKAKAKQMQDLLHLIMRHEKDIAQALQEFKELEDQKWYVSDRQFRMWKQKFAFLGSEVDRKFLVLKTDDPIKNSIADFFARFDDGRRLFIDKINENFVRQETPIIKKILDGKDIKNNSDQLTAIASDEDNTLLVAGAGTGKTTTILGKLAYLLERVKVQPEEILLLSFTGGAVEELAQRIRKNFGELPVKVRTFHSFGLSIIGQATGKKPDIAFPHANERKKFFNDTFNNLLKDEKYMSLSVEYFAYYFKPVVLEPGFFNLDDYYKYAYADNNLTLKKEWVKSQQEVMIANFLYLNGIEYVYEKPYEHETADADYKQYKPDFFLPEYGIYLEHFGINRKGETRFTSDPVQNYINSEKYRQGMDWKRGLHSRYETVLVETFSYEFTEKNWQELLKSKLMSHQVKFVPVDMKEVFAALANDLDIKKIVQLMVTFLDLSRSNGFDVLRLGEKVFSRNVMREQAFFELYVPLCQAYESHLKETGTIDFHDMLNRAAGLISDGSAVVKLRYIIIDEFQDFSVSKYHLVKALCEQNPEVKLFCVGDDWQSIFRFTGSDISLMTEFEEKYGFTQKDQLVVTNRFNDRLAAVTNRFILKNPQQIKKEVRANRHIDGEAVEIFTSKRNDDPDHLLRKIFGFISKEVSKTSKKATVFVLGRYKHNKPHNFESFQKEHPELTVDFHTVHGSKGMEADYVIIVDMISGKYGFPSGVTDDPLLSIVLDKEESYPHAEERRLMYVAMTRARNKVYILTEDHHESVFVLELEGTQHAEEGIVRCDECGGEMTKRKGPYSHFYGCTNFPKCRNTKNIK